MLSPAPANASTPEAQTKGLPQRMDECPDGEVVAEMVAREFVAKWSSETSEPGKSSLRCNGTEEAKEDQTTRITQILDTWLIRMEETMCRMSQQQSQLDDIIDTLDEKCTLRPNFFPQQKKDKDKRTSDVSHANSMATSVPSSAMGASRRSMTADTMASAASYPVASSAASAWNQYKNVMRSSEARTRASKATKSGAFFPIGRGRHGRIMSTMSETIGHIQTTRGVPLLKAIEGTTTFDVVCILMVLMNTVLVSVEAEAMTHKSFFAAHSETFFILQLSLNCWFTVELLLRLGGEGPAFFFGSEWRWNLFDTSILMMSVLDLVLTLDLITNDEGVKTDQVPGGILKAIRLIRVFRTLRIYRAFSNIREFRKMVFALQSSIQTGFWSLFLLFCFMYLFAILFTQGVAEHLQGLTHDGRFEDMNLRLHERYGSMTRCMYTLYMAITTGIAWGECFELLLHVEVFYGVLFLLFVSASMFCVMNVIAAVFVESAMTSAQYYKDLIIEDTIKAKEIVVQHMKDVFSGISDHVQGKITISDFEELLKVPQTQVYLESLDLSVEDTRLLFALLDADGSGNITLDEFCQGCLKLKGDAKSFDMHVLLSEVDKIGQAILPLREKVDKANKAISALTKLFSNGYIGDSASLRLAHIHQKNGTSSL